MANPYSNAQLVKLSDYITPDKFRTILPECRHTYGGVSEVPAEILIKKTTRKRFSFDIPWDGLLYGFCRGKNELAAKIDGIEKVAAISIQDWNDKFLLLFEGTESGEETAFFVTQDDVVELLENCRRVPEQKSNK